MTESSPLPRPHRLPAARGQWIAAKSCPPTSFIAVSTRRLQSAVTTRTEHTGRSSTGRSDGSYSRSGYSSYDSDTAVLTGAIPRIAPHTQHWKEHGQDGPSSGGRTDRTETTIEEEGSEEEDQSDNEEDGISEEKQLKLHSDALQMNASAEAIAAKLSRQASGPNRLSRA